MLPIKDTDYVIVEIIPTSKNPSNGKIIQLSALKLHGLELIDRFDARLKDEFLPIPEMKSWINYDNEAFNYYNSCEDILKDFKSWVNNYPLLVLDKIYTPLYLNNISDNIILILDYLNEEYSVDIINKLIDKYNLEPSNYIVDLLYECLIKEIK